MKSQIILQVTLASKKHTRNDNWTQAKLKNFKWKQ